MKYLEYQIIVDNLSKQIELGKEINYEFYKQ